MAHRTGLYGLLFAALLLMIAALGIPTTRLQAQPRATLEARTQGIQQTAQAQALAIQQTAQASASGIQQTVQTGVGAMQGTLESQAPIIAATVQAGVDQALGLSADAGTQIAATIQAVATTLSQQAGDIQSTAAAISATVQASLESLPPELAELLGYLAQQTSVEFDPDTKLLTLTSYITEQQANDLQDIVVEAAGYNPEAVSLDTRADGTIQVSLVDVSGTLPGTMVLTYQVVVVDGRVTATLTGVTLNGAAVPVERVPEDLRSAVELGVIGAALQTAVNVPAAIPFTYTIQSVTVSEEGILVVYVVTLI
ncbi:MAG: hypothetical protein K8J31_13825 [Anaerolineae bacterium]|nr:hypothetical protein [Anaerolineae bacterium]